MVVVLENLHDKFTCLCPFTLTIQNCFFFVCAFTGSYTVVPLLKDTLPKGHLSNKDRIIIWQEVLWMP